MKTSARYVIAAGVILSSLAASAETRKSASYGFVTETQDAGGHRASSVNYVADSSVGTISGVSTAPTPPETLKSGYVGQLYDAVALTIAACTTNVNEGTTLQLAAVQLIDDGTAVAMAGCDVAWTVLSGPIDSISTGGLATAGYVYQDTPASVAGSAVGFSNALGLTVINVTFDDFGLYAGDGMEDHWQVLYFGEENPEAGPGKDPDFDGRDNLFEFLALTVPTNAASFFNLRARQTPSESCSMDLTFGPIRTGRTYTVLYSLDLSPSGWSELGGYSQSDNGDERTVTDPGASGARKFYRVRIGR